MSSIFPKRKRTAGFSLGEVLVALAVAAMMAAALTRFYASTRANAARVGEVLEMETLGETMLARTASLQNIKPGITEGRSGLFSWRILITPVNFQAVARQINPPKKTEPEQGQNSGLKLSSFGSGVAQEDQQKSTDIPQVEWIPYRVAIVIAAPSGRKHATDTIRLGPAQIPER
jgi:type II secretory pathway pseudopilin PulG